MIVTIAEPLNYSDMNPTVGNCHIDVPELSP